MLKGAYIHPPLVGLLVADVLATTTTLVRLGHRYRRRQLWWDDFWALFACLIAWMLVITVSLVSFADYTTPTPPFSYRTASFLSWTNFFTQPSAVWCSRLSIQATVIRFLPPGRNKDISRYAFAALVTMWIITSVSKAFYCGIPIPALPLCLFSEVPTAISLSFSIMGTLWLVAWPAYIVVRMRLARPHRRLFIACFSITGLLAVVDILHEVSIFRWAWWITPISAHVEVMIAIVASNVLTLVAYLYRVYRSSHADTGSSVTEKSSEDSNSTSKPGVTATDATTGPPSTHQLANGSSVVGSLTAIYTDELFDDYPAGVSRSRVLSETEDELNAEPRSHSPSTHA